MRLLYMSLLNFIFLPSALNADELFGRSWNDFNRPPAVVLGLADGEIYGNGGEAYGGEFAKVIYIDVYEFLRDQFHRKQIPASNPLSILSDKMTRFESLLREHDRVAAVDQVVDSTGHDILARVVPQKSTFVFAGAQSTNEFFTAHASVTLLTTSAPRSPEGLILRVQRDARVSEIVLNADAHALSFVRLGARPLTVDGLLLPPGMKFYSLCAQGFDLMTFQQNPNLDIEILCGGYNLDGSVATLRGSLKRDTNSGTDQLRYAGEIQIKLSVQVYGIEVNRKEFDHLRTTASKTIVDRLIFHEYLRLLGVDDNGFKVSMHLEALRRKAFAEPQFPYVGAQVYVPAGVEYLDEKDNQLRRLNTPNRTPRGRYGLIKNIYDVNFRSRAGVELARVVEVQISDVPGLYQIFYHFISDVKHVVKPVP